MDSEAMTRDETRCQETFSSPSSLIKSFSSSPERTRRRRAKANNLSLELSTIVIATSPRVYMATFINMEMKYSCKHKSSPEVSGTKMLFLAFASASLCSLLIAAFSPKLTECYMLNDEQRAMIIKMLKEEELLLEHIKRAINPEHSF
jgi:hypothetical protein